MLTFSDLIANNVAPSPYRMNVVTTTGFDRLIINYNNIWGCISDTHMSKGDDGVYYITGQLLQDEMKFKDFLFSSYWGGYCFKDSSLRVTTLHEYLKMFGYAAVRQTRNGDCVAVLKPIEEVKEPDGNVDSGIIVPAAAQ